MDDTSTVKYYEVEFADGYSIAIKGLYMPTVEEANTFCSKEVNKYGKVVVVYNITRAEVEAFFDTTNIEIWPVFGF